MSSCHAAAENAIRSCVNVQSEARASPNGPLHAVRLRSSRVQACGAEVLFESVYRRWKWKAPHCDVKSPAWRAYSDRLWLKGIFIPSRPVINHSRSLASAVQEADGRAFHGSRLNPVFVLPKINTGEVQILNYYYRRLGSWIPPLSRQWWDSRTK